MPSSKIATVLDFAKGLLLFPQPDNAVEGGIAQEFLHSREEFDKNAEAWTKRHAAKAKDPPKLS